MKDMKCVQYNSSFRQFLLQTIAWFLCCVTSARISSKWLKCVFLLNMNTHKKMPLHQFTARNKSILTSLHHLIYVNAYFDFFVQRSLKINWNTRIHFRLTATHIIDWSAAANSNTLIPIKVCYNNVAVQFVCVVCYHGSLMLFHSPHSLRFIRAKNRVYVINTLYIEHSTHWMNQWKNRWMDEWNKGPGVKCSALLWKILITLMKFGMCVCVYCLAGVFTHDEKSVISACLAPVWVVIRKHSLRYSALCTKRIFTENVGIWWSNLHLIWVYVVSINNALRTYTHTLKT